MVVAKYYEGSTEDSGVDKKGLIEPRFAVREAEQKTRCRDRSLTVAPSMMCAAADRRRHERSRGDNGMK